MGAVVPHRHRADTVGMAYNGSLANQLLIAMPGMADPNFSSTVTLICEHNDEGALGIVINLFTTLFGSRLCWTSNSAACSNNST